MILDRHADKPDGVKHYKSLESCQEYDGPKALTGGGGAHLIFKLPPFDVNSLGKHGIDVKVKGYIIVPPSQHPNGKEYKWVEGHSRFEKPPQQCPDWLEPHIAKVSVIGPNTNEQKDRQSFKTFLPANSDLVISRCAFVRHCVEDAESLAEPDWYFGLIGSLTHCVDGREAIHRFSQGHPGYTILETDKKIRQWEQGGKHPVTCKSIQKNCGDHYCQSCPYNGLVNSPVNLSYASKPKNPHNVRAQFPLHALPTVLRDYASTISEAVQSPADYIACSLLVVASILIGSQRYIQLTSEWEQLCNLWLACVGSPTSKKSPAINKAFLALRGIEDTLFKKYKQEMFDYKLKLEKYDVELKAWKKGQTDEQPIKPEKPICQRLTTNDITIEALAKLLSQNPYGLGLTPDELSSFSRSMNQYKSKGADRSNYLSLLSNEQLIIDRKNEDEPIFIQTPFLSIIGGIQPDALKEIVDQRIDDGMKERFLYCCPAPNDELPNKGISVPPNVKAATISLLTTIFSRRTVEKVTVGLSPEAADLFHRYKKESHIEVHSDDFPKEMAAYYGKMISYLGRLTLILHEVKQVQGANEDAVSAETMKEAKSLADYFLSHAKVAFNYLHQTNEEQKILAVWEWISRKKLPVVSPRDIQTGKVARCAKASEAKTLLKLLSDYGYGYWNPTTSRLVIYQ